ncbi:hypothetical protein, partial [Dulcicalothrix desertica]|uniref:hypothetical protein n=1 Tax=Dulcicalothrix desertica TaxID=32056 RepID=UPI001F40CC0E
ATIVGELSPATIARCQGNITKQKPSLGYKRRLLLLENIKRSFSVQGRNFNIFTLKASAPNT